MPVLCDFIIVSFFGNSALYEVLQGNTAFAELAVQSPEHGWYALLELFPGATILIVLATLSGLLFYITSANSGAMVMSNFSTSIPDPSEDATKVATYFLGGVDGSIDHLYVDCRRRHYHGICHAYLCSSCDDYCLSGDVLFF